MRSTCFPIWFLLCCFLVKAHSVNILYLAGVGSPSHQLWNFKLIEALTIRGHNLTVLSMNKARHPIKNAYILDMEEVYSKFYDFDQTEMENYLNWGIINEIEGPFEFMMSFCQLCGETAAFKTLLNYPDDFKFDLIINDFTISSCLLGFLHKFNYPPLVGVSPYKYSTMLAEALGGHHYPAYIPHLVLPFNVNMTLAQRFQNAVVKLYEIFYKRFIFQPKFDAVVASMTGIKNLPSIAELERKTTIMLLNTHPSTDFPISLPPNIIEVGGLQISEPQPLPEDLEQFINKSKEGAVLISFGTNVNKYLFGNERQNIVIEVAKKFPNYNFLWKFEMDLSEGKVPNLMVRTWLPQNDILAHPKIKAFVSHGGGLSTQEATWHGVPLVTVPFFGDQKTNAYRATIAGIATNVDPMKMTINDFETAIRTVLDNSAYTARAKLLSIRFRSRPVKPLNTAIWWIEYILKDPNPIHLRSPAVELGSFKAGCYDLLLYCFIVFVIAIYIVRYLLIMLCKFIKKISFREKVKTN